jgi:PAS domain S-box-containing protein
MSLESVSRSLSVSVPLESILEGLDEAAVLIDRDKRVRWLNRVAVELLGAGADEAVGRPCWEVVASDICGAKCLLDGDWEPQGMKCHLGARLKRHERAIPVSVRTAGVQDRRGHQWGMIELLRDARQISGLVVDLQRSRDEILAKELRMEAILNSISEGVMTTDGNLKVIGFNRTAERITGWGEKEVLGKSCPDLLGFRPKESPLQRTILCGTPVLGEETTFRHKSGSRIPVRVNTSLLRDANGKVLGGVETFRDLGEMKRLAMRYMDQTPFWGIVGKSRKLREVLDLVGQIKDSGSTVLITGESGTGKGLLAKAVHLSGERRDKPFVKVNCSVFAESLLESELFGHERGAFTGAVRATKGRFEVAHGGTLFLDEIGEVSKNIQLKLLGVLQEREFERVGSSRPVKVDVRIIAATNKDLLKAVRNREFREDLYYRLNVIPIHLPPLRERRDDIPLLADFIIGKFAERTGRKPKRLSAEAMSRLHGYAWAGNVRELENVIEHGLVCSRGQAITPDSLPAYLLEAAVHASGGDQRAGGGEEKRILEALEAAKWNRKKAAESLNINRATLWRRMRRYGMA